MENLDRVASANKTLIRQRESDTSDKKEKSEADSLQKEAMDFVEKNRDLFEHVARGKINIRHAPPDLNTFAFDLRTNDLLISPRFYKNRGFSEEQTTFATLHEIEHLLEKKKILSESGGASAFARYLSRIEKSRAYKVMDNCLADIRENETVIAKTNKSFADVEQKMYKEDLFKEIDFTDKPKHLQLPMAMLREARVPDERVVVDPEVRAALDEIKAVAAKDGTKLTDIIRHPDTPMSSRLKIQDKYIWPQVEKLLESDMKEEDEHSGENGQSGGEGGEPSEGEQQEGGGSSENEKSEKAESGKKSNEGASSKDPNKRFEKSYDQADAQMPHAIPAEDMRKAFEEWEKEYTDPYEAADQAYADKLGVRKEDIQKYRALADEVRAISNPETQQSVVDDLRDLVARIIAHRKKERQAPRYPVEEGDDLADPAELVSQVKEGNFEPKVWETQEIKMEKGKRFGKVEITLVGDRSGSMEGVKCREQQKAVVLFMEALKEFGDLAREESFNLQKPLSVESEIYAFQSSEEDRSPLKEMSEDLSEKDCVSVALILESAPGSSTTDFVPLESILAGIDEEKKRLIGEGEIKKIVIVFTDGGSDDPSRVSRALERLRAVGVIVVGIGITQEGAPALTTYAPTAKLAETAEKLPQALAETLREHLSDI